MSGQDSNDRIAELLKEACPPAAASPGFKAELRQEIIAQSVAMRAQTSRHFWQRPLLWIPAAAVAAVAAVLIIYFAALPSKQLTVTTSDATAIETTTATLLGKLDNLPETDGVQVSFEWGVGTNYGYETSPEVPSESGSVRVSLSGLEPNTTYHFRIKIVDSNGTRYGPDTTFTTGPLPPKATTRDATKIGAHSAVLNGSLDDMGSSDRVRVSFEWGQTTSYGNETTAELKTATGKCAAEVPRLISGTTYHFRIKAAGDDTAYGADMQFTTDIIPPSVETEEATEIGVLSARLNGELTSLGSAASTTVSFVWGTTSGGPYTETSPQQVSIQSGTFSADLSGLRPGGTYYYKARADGDGEAVYGAERSFVTLTAPPLVTTSSATAVHATSAVLNGVLDSLGTAESAEVYFEWGLSTSYENLTTSGSMASVGTFSATLTGLSPGTTYHFRARAVGQDSAPGADMIFVTGSMPPEQNAWYLSQDASDNTNVMYEGDESRPTGIVTLFSSGVPSSRVWKADQAASTDTTYPAGVWAVSMLFSDISSTDNVLVEIGTWNGNSGFVPYGSGTFLGQGTSDSTVYMYEDNISVSSFSMPSGTCVAVRIRVAAGHMVNVHVGGAQSLVRSPAYAEIIAPTITTAAASDVQRETATLNAYLDSTGTGGPVAVYFEWGVTAAYDNRVEVGSVSSTDAVTFVLSGLAPDTTYHFRAMAVGDGTTYGVDLTFTTLP